MFKKIAVLSLALATQFASADTPITKEMAHLNAGKIDRQVLGNNTFESGSVHIDYMFKKLTLTIVRAKDCPRGMACTQEAVEPVRVVLPVVSVKKGSCGEVTIVAVRDDLPVDGIFQEVVVKDYRTFLCDLYVPYFTVVDYRSAAVYMTGREVRTQSFLAGEKLAPTSKR